MALENNIYSVHLYRDSQTQRLPVREYLESLSMKERGKIDGRIQYLKENEGRLPMPYARYVREGVWELRSEAQNRPQRIMYVTASGKRIILLHGFTKRTQKTPEQEIKRGLENFKDFKATNQSIAYGEK